MTTLDRDVVDAVRKNRASAAAAAPPRTHHAGLDGLRGLAVAAVLLFHHPMGWMKGGFLGVSTFFTLSGFLITGLLLDERTSLGRIRLGRFWERRFRRLLPALIVSIVVTAAFARQLAATDQLDSIRKDGLATLGYVANWRFIFSGQSYTALFSAPSPLLHTWSLAIEEQFYVLFPLLVTSVLALSKGRRRPLAAVLVALTAGSVLSAVVLSEDHTRVYYGTDTRAAELLFGALLAVGFASRRDAGDRRRPAMAAIGAVALGLSVLAWVTVSQTADWLYQGGFALYGAGSAAVVAAAVAPGPVRWLLSRRPLPGIGRISYGLYLYHWPIYLWLAPDRFDGLGAALFPLRLTVTLAAALVSYHLVEQPIRRGAWRGWRALAAAPVAAGVVTSLLVVATVVPQGQRQLVADLAPPVPVVPAAPFAPAPRVATAAVPLRVLMVGDSVGYDAEPGIAAALQATGAVDFSAENDLGFGLTNGTVDWAQAWAGLVEARRPELAIMLLGGWDETYIATNGLAAYEETAARAIGVLSRSGADVLVLGYPITVDRVTRAVNPRRSVDAFAAAAARFPGRVHFQTLDPALSPDDRFVDHLPGPDGRPERVRKVDGTHFCPGGSARIGQLVLDALSPVWSIPVPTPTWRTGTWASDPRYDTPTGACPP